MNKLICLCLVSLQLVGGISDSSIFKQPETVISTILNIFERNFTHNVDENVNFPKESFLFDERNDALCMEQVNAIMMGLNNSELWAIKSEFLCKIFNFFVDLISTQ